MDFSLLVWGSNPRTCQYEAGVIVTQLWISELISEMVFSSCSNVWWKLNCIRLWFGEMTCIWHILISCHNTIRMNEWMFIELFYGVEEKIMANVLPIPRHVPYGLRDLPSQLWSKCNWLLRLGRPWGTVTLSWWGGWWYMNMKYQEGP
jgi:hypothetical protein